MCHSMKKTTVFLADDHPVIRSGIKALFSARSDYEVVGEAGGGVEALAGIKDLMPEVVIMDISMPDLNGIAATKRILEELPNTRVVILSAHSDVYNAIDAFRAGALAYVLKDSAPDEIMHAVGKVLTGQKYASPAVAADLLNDFVDVLKKDTLVDPFGSLSSREREVLKLVAEGATSREIADKLFISIATVKSHRNNLMRKLKASDTAGLVRIAIKKGIIQTD